MESTHLKSTDLEEAIKGKVASLLEQTMEKHWGLSIPKLESDITDRLRQPAFLQLSMYLPLHMRFSKAKKLFRAEFLKQELRLHRGNVSSLAKRLDLDRRSVHRAIKDLAINVDTIRHMHGVRGMDDMHALEPSERYQQQFVDKAIRQSLEQYHSLLQPRQLEKVYKEIPELSRNIAKFLPHQDTSWKEAEQEFEKAYLKQALAQYGWNVARTAASIGLRAETLHRKIKKLGLR